jgi:hypothetical protein
VPRLHAETLEEFALIRATVFARKASGFPLADVPQKLIPEFPNQTKPPMKKTLFILPLAAAALCLGACDNKATSEKKDALEKKADALENKADAAKDEAAAKAHEEKAAGEAKAAGAKTEGEQKANELKNEAKEKREEKKDVPNNP